MVQSFCSLPVAHLQPQKLACLLDQFRVMAAHQHQPFSGAFRQDRPDPLGRFHIQKGSGFIEHLHRAVELGAGTDRIPEADPQSRGLSDRIFLNANQLGSSARQLLAE